jgi:hypothetical protein
VPKNPVNASDPQNFHQISTWGTIPGGGQESGTSGAKACPYLDSFNGTTEVVPFPVRGSFTARDGMGLPPLQVLESTGQI